MSELDLNLQLFYSHKNWTLMDSVLSAIWISLIEAGTEAVSHWNIFLKLQYCTENAYSSHIRISFVTMFLVHNFRKFYWRYNSTCRKSTPKSNMCHYIRVRFATSVCGGVCMCMCVGVYVWQLKLVFPCIVVIPLQSVRLRELYIIFFGQPELSANINKRS